ncbi:MAG: diaminopimelate epimerase [Gammaproteobacteria bacterium]|jgi:diaminopimelate epimerase
MNVRFAKMHGLGNDFMVLDLVSQDIALNPRLVRCWSDRHTGVGFDQLLTIEPPSDPDVDFRYRIYNADGSEAEQCGNGARCIARYALHTGLSAKSELRFQTANGRIGTRLLEHGHVEVDMGVPVLDPVRIPCDVSHAESSCPVGSTIRYRLRDEAGDVHELITLSMGNPHGVLFVDDIADAPVLEVGAALTGHRFFPERANIGFCQIVDTNFVRLRVFERGVGETRACGTGACAAVVAGILSGQLDARAKVSLPGGKVRVRWQGADATVRMAGPATLVYEGQITTE